MMHYAVTKLGGENLPRFGFVHNEAFHGGRMVAAGMDVPLKLEKTLA